MRLGVFYSDFRGGSDVLSRLTAEKLGIILVGNGVYHATVKENGSASPILNSKADFYVLTEDLETRGFTVDKLPGNVKPVTYDDIVDLIFNDYDKVIWL
jgi:sulfur relay protein TusB/DsrH